MNFWKIIFVAATFVVLKSTAFAAPEIIQPGAVCLKTTVEKLVRLLLEGQRRFGVFHVSLPDAIAAIKNPPHLSLACARGLAGMLEITIPNSWVSSTLILSPFSFDKGGLCHEWIGNVIKVSLLFSGVRGWRITSATVSECI